MRLDLAPIVCSGHLRVDATFTTRFIQSQKHCRNRSSPLFSYQKPLLVLLKDNPDYRQLFREFSVKLLPVFTLGRYGSCGLALVLSLFECMALVVILLTAT